MVLSDEDGAAIETILARQCAAWAGGDAAAFGGDVAEGVLFTNILGMFSIGRGPFTAQHAQIFASIYKGSTLQQDPVSVTVIRPDVAIVDTLARVSGAPNHPPGIELIDGAVQTRLEQVMVKDDGVWRVASFHNVAVHPIAAGQAPPGSV